MSKKTKGKKFDGTVSLRRVRLAYPHLDTPRPSIGGKLQYDCTFIVEPGSENDRAIQKAIQRAAEHVFEEEAEDKLLEFKHQPSKNCYTDGNRKKDRDGFAGNMLLAAKRDGKLPPPPVRSAKNRVKLEDGRIAAGPVVPTDEDYPYGGCYVDAKVEIWAQDSVITDKETGRKMPVQGIRCALLTVIFKEHGDRFGGFAAVTEDDFVLSDGADAPDITGEDDE